MCDNGVYRDLTNGFIYENIACQKGKGQDLAIRIIVGFLQELHRSAPGRTVWGVHLDVRKYFPSTPQKLVKELDRAKITEPLFIPYLDEIIDMQEDSRSREEIAADPFGKRGTGLGSQINQLNQIALLDGLDHRLKALGRYYIRYNDDILFLSHDRSLVRLAKQTAGEHLRTLGLTLQDKYGIFKAKNGFYFLRKRFILTDSGKIVIRLHPRAMADERRTLRSLKRKLDLKQRDMDAVKRHYQSWIAGAEYAGDAPIRTMDKFYTQLFRQKPEYKRSRRYLYGHHCDKQRKDQTAGAGKAGAAGREQPAESGA